MAKMAVQPRKKALGALHHQRGAKNMAEHFNTRHISTLIKSLGKNLLTYCSSFLCGHEFSRYQFVVGNATISLWNMNTRPLHFPSRKTWKYVNSFRDSVAMYVLCDLTTNVRDKTKLFKTNKVIKTMSEHNVFILKNTNIWHWSVSIF